MKLTRLLRKTRLRFKRFTVTNRVVSFGGVGSSSLIAHLEDGDRDRIWYHSRDKHCLHPDLLPEARRGLEVKACFLFGNPYHAVLSVFRRGLHPRHERSMTRSVPGYKRVIRKDTSVLEYLQAGEDRFFLRKHLENWVGYDGNRVKVLAVKYEALDEHIEEIMAFLECARPFPVRPRSSRFHDEPPEIQSALEAMYGSLKEKIDGLPTLIRVNP
jgi:hypothetical protein